MLEHFDGLSRPDRPLAEHPAHHAQFDAAIGRDFKAIGREQIQNDMVVVAGIESNVAPASLGHCAHHVDGVVTVERRDFDRDNIFQFNEAPPKGEREHPATDRGLEIKADQRNDFSDGSAMRD